MTRSFWQTVSKFTSIAPVTRASAPGRQQGPTEKFAPPQNMDARSTIDILDRIAGYVGAIGRDQSKAAQSSTLSLLARHYATCAAELATANAFRSASAGREDWPEDDGSIDFVRRTNIYIPGGEVEIEAEREEFPWAHFFSDADCGIFLVCGQSNAANHGSGDADASADVFALNFMTMRCHSAQDPLPGASGSGASIWPRLGNLLIERGFYKRVLFVPIAFGGTYISDWTVYGPTRGRLTLTLSRLRKRLGRALLDFDATFWQQGEAEANLTSMTAEEYMVRFASVLGVLRAQGVFGPVIVSQSTLCEGSSPHPFRNHDAIREGQFRVADPSRGVFRGPDTDSIGLDARHDGCHFSETGLDRAAMLWLETIETHRDLLITARASGKS